MKLQIAGTIWNWDISHSKLLPALQDYAGTQKPITIAFSSGTDLEAPGYYAIPHQFMMALVSASCSMKLENYIGQLECSYCPVLLMGSEQALTLDSY